MAERKFDLATLRQLLERIPDLKVACIGDVMVDRYVYGEVSRISPEAPIPVLRARQTVSMPGGVGNVARNVAALGGRVRLGAVIGADTAGDELKSLIESENGIEGVFARPDGVSTIVKTRFVSGGQQLLRLDDESGLHPAYSETDVFEGACAIFLSDYAKGAIGQDTIDMALQAGRAAGIPVIVDPKGKDFARYGAVDLIKPNASELAGATGMPTGTDEEVEAALTSLLAATEAKAVIVTRAGKGMSLMRRGEAVAHFPGRAREVFDVSGAGDTCLAAMGLALASGLSLEFAAQFAVLASGVVVGKAGTAIVTPQELLDAEQQDHAKPVLGGLLSLDEVEAQVATWKRQGLKVGFTNGCFDILHRGHVTYLAQARSWCDRLVVALNTDASVRALKGDSRPVNDLDSRAEVMGALASVDAVTSFADSTPLEIIKALRPDVLIKGADYTKDQVVGAAEVESWGGSVRLAQFADGYSTTNTIRKMVGS